VQKPYVGLAITLFILAGAIAWSKLPKNQRQPMKSRAKRRGQRPKSAFGYRHLMLGAVAIFVYVGGEVAIGSFLVNYLKEPAIAGLPEKVGATYLPYYWEALWWAASWARRSCAISDPAACWLCLRVSPASWC